MRIERITEIKAVALKRENYKGSEFYNLLMKRIKPQPPRRPR